MKKQIGIVSRLATPSVGLTMISPAAPAADLARDTHPGDLNAYLKFCVYKPGWQRSPSSIDVVTLYFGEVLISAKEDEQ